uniref:Uncharacterized protein n=1 Tax=Noccaea caerulescens TaxID=107243 RepID=A0A1J3E775_NOCCA
MVRQQQRASKVHEDRYPSCHSRGSSEHQGKNELVKHDMLDPPRYLRRNEDIRGKALSFGVLDWKELEKWKDSSSTADGGAKGASCSYASSSETAASSLELDLKPQAPSVSLFADLRNGSFSLRSQEYPDHQSLSGKQKEDQTSLNKKNLAEKEQSNAFDPRSETSSKLLSECQDRRHNAQGECSSPVNVTERNEVSAEKPGLLSDQNIPTVTSKKGRHASPNKRFSFSFSQMSRSFSSKESSSSVHALSTTSHASPKSGPLTFHDSTRTAKTNNGHNRSRSGPILKPKNVPSLQVASKPSNPRPQTVEKKQRSSRSHALLQFTLRKGINLFQFVVDDNSSDVLAATMKSSDSSRRSYTLYSVKEVKNKSGGNWLGRHHKNEERNHPFVHTIIGEMNTNSDLARHISESVLYGVETKEELAAAVVQTRNRVQKQSTTSVIFPSGAHTLPKDGGDAPLPLIERWKSGGACDCGGWDIGCKLRVLCNDHYTKSQTFSSFQLFDQERDEPAFKMVTHDDELHSVEFGSSISVLEAFFISLAVSSHQKWCEEVEEEAVLNGDALLKRETSSRYASNPPVSPIGRV